MISPILEKATSYIIQMYWSMPNASIPQKHAA